jgi:transposase
MIETESVMSKDVFYVGVDVGKDEVWASIESMKPKSFKHNPTGMKSLMNWAKRHAKGVSVHFCLEGTGVYAVSVVTLLLKVSEERISVVNPAQIKSFANAQLRRCKTDRVDAEVIRQFAEATHPPLWKPPSGSQQELYELVLLRDQLSTEMRRWENRRHSRKYLENVPQVIRKMHQSMIRSLGRQLEKVEQAIRAFVAQDAETAQKVALLTTIPGIAETSSVQLIAYGQRWLTERSPKALVAHAGLAPHPKQSGSSLRGRGSLDKRGNRKIRTLLYMPTVTAITHNPIIRNFYNRLCSNGKPRMVAIAAAEKKLLLIARAVLIHKTPFTVLNPH